MSNTIFLSVASFCYILMITFIYFSKERVNTSETRIFTRLLIVSLVSLVSELYITIIPINMEIPIFVFSLKLYLLLCVLWLSYFMEYVFIITRNNKEKSLINYKQNYKNIYYIFWGIVAIILLVVILLPIYFFNENGMKYSYGASVDLVFALSGIYTLIMLFYVIKNIKRIKNNGYIPIIFLIILMAIIGIVQKINPALLLANTCFALITSLMYHTIENPDVKMVNELIENRRIIERTSEEKSVFLFKMSQGLREEVNNIDKQVNIYKEGNLSNEDKDLIIDVIDKNNQKINYLISDVLGLNSFDNTNIKKIENTYNIYSLLEDINRRGNQYKYEGVNYRFTIVDNMPKELYGDSIKLKQILMSVLINALENTSEGFVHVDVISFTKYDICRIVITIEDSGTGISITDINNILDQDLELTEQDYLKIEKLDVDLPLAYKMIKMLGGTMYIKSEEDKGTEAIITIDQYIVENEDVKNTSKVDKYLKTRGNNKKILIVNDNEEETRKIRKALEHKGYEVVISMYGQDAIDRIRNKEKYDVILIDDEMPLMNGINVLEKLKELKNKSKMIVLLGKDKLFIADHYVEDGFDDFIDKTKLFDEIKEKF